MSDARIHIMSDREYASALPEPSADANKYTRGRLLVVAGSEQYPGAAMLAALSAARSGAGYVRLATADPIVALAQTNLLTVPVISLPSDEEGVITTDARKHIEQLMAQSDALVIGPGLGRSVGVAKLVRDIVTGSTVPILIDADGLNAFIDHIDLLAHTSAPIILTPHSGELARLAPIDELATGLCTVVAKGPETTIRSAERSLVDDTGPASLATAGTGDVLAGIIGALLCQGVDPFTAAAAGVRVQALAALCATEDLSASCMIATDVIEYIPCAFACMKECAAHA
ncbi:MAG: NAD(P)H-hydrate dehydratase [Actinomycetia bacterium]|nr:NAD(P)H-hydrate dehydratase [Actinomycetes bacterium]